VVRWSVVGWDVVGWDVVGWDVVGWDVVGWKVVVVCLPSVIDLGRIVTRFAECRCLMPEEFDPYSQWLGILGHERPVDHYRLLGVARFTSDPVAITAAADQRMAMIRSYQTGPRGRFTQRLLNEIAAAKLCLINPSSKAAYDAMLEGLALATQPPPLAAPPPPPTPAAPPPWNASDHPRPVVAIVEEETEEDVPEARGAVESMGLSVGSALLGLVIVAAVGSYLTWHVIDGQRRTLTSDAPRTSDAPQTGGEQVQPPETLGQGESAAAAVDDGPVVVMQETDGSVNFTPVVAILKGASVRLETDGITNLLTGWASVDDAAVWTFKIVKLPPNGVFRVLVTYRATTPADEGSFQLALSGRQRTCQVRGVGEFVTDEYFLAVTRSGEQSLELRSPGMRGGEFQLKGIRLAMPKGDAS